MIDQRKHENNTFDRKDFSGLTTKEKKLLEVSPNLTPDEIKTHLLKVDFDKSKQNAKIENELNSKKGENSRDTYYQHLDSDIFHTQNKVKNIPKHAKQKSHANIQVKNTLDQNKNPFIINGKNEKVKSKPTGELKGWSCKLDWKDINGAVYFHKKNE